MLQKTVVVLGASPKITRYSNQAVKALLHHNHKVLPVNPVVSRIHGQTCFQNMTAIEEPVHTLTAYVGKKRSDDMIDSILALNPQRIILNPGAENDRLQQKAEQAGIEVVQGCTLVMLKTDQF